ncbi:MAG: helix-turn-helix transcriptional regulator [Oscillospiraceae bacterium]|nr:helix-turn-helix transcriptional regulator [Oscillospiraceae bacterium]
MKGDIMDSNLVPKTVGERIKSLREKAKESQKELGELLGLTQNAISKLENGDTALTLENQIRIAEHYNVSHDYLCTGRNNDTILELLSKYISLGYTTVSEGQEISITYPVMKIDKHLFAYLVRTSQACNNEFMPEEVKERWIQLETSLFYEANKNNDFSEKECIVPLPPKFILPDDQKNTWRQADLLRELHNYWVNQNKKEPKCGENEKETK